MKKRIFLCIFLALAITLSLCLASCGGDSGSGDNGGAADNVYEMVEPNPTSAYYYYSGLTNAVGKNTLTINDNGTFSITRAETRKNESVTDGLTVSSFTETMIYTGTYEKTGEDTVLLTVTGGVVKYSAGTEEEKQAIIEYFKESGNSEAAKRIEAFSENGYTATPEEVENLSRTTGEFLLVKGKKLAYLTRKFYDGELSTTYEYDPEMRCVSEVYGSNRKDFRYGENVELTGYSETYTDGASESVYDYSVINGKLVRTCRTRTENGVILYKTYYDENGEITEEHYYDENGNEITG